MKNLFKWTKSSKLLSNATNQSNFNKKRLRSLNITPPYNPHSKYVFVSDNLLYLHCGKNGHLKGECASWKNSYEKLSNMLKGKIYQKRDLVLQSMFQLTNFQRKNLSLLPCTLLERFKIYPIGLNPI